MRMTMPKLNSVLIATRATVIRLEEERDALLTQDRNLSASIQAALRDGSAAARSVAEEDAIQLQQLRGDLTSTQEQLLAASKAHEASKMSVDVLKTRLKEKIELSQRALKDRQKAQVMRVAADAIVELQSYGVASSRSSRKWPSRRPRSKWPLAASTPPPSSASAPRASSRPPASCSSSNSRWASARRRWPLRRV
jgi:uncharacterized protein YPO0396